MKTSVVKTKNIEIEYIKFGRGKKNLVVIPGLFSTILDLKKQRFYFYKNYRDFKNEYTVYIFGKNKIIKENYSIKKMAEDELKAIKILKLNNINLIGVSEGGMISQEMAKDDVIKNLAICVSTSKTDENTKNIMNEWINYINENDYESFIENVGKNALNKNIKGNKIISTMAKRIIDKDELIAHINACKYHDATNEIQKLNKNVLIIAGEKDKLITKDNSEIMKKHIKNSEIKVFKNMNHDVYSNSKKVNKKIYHFFDKNY